MRNSHFHGEEPQQRVFFTDPRRLLFYREEVGNLNDACSIKKGMVFFFDVLLLYVSLGSLRVIFVWRKTKKDHPPECFFQSASFFVAVGIVKARGSSNICRKSQLDLDKCIGSQSSLPT